MVFIALICSSDISEMSSTYINFNKENNKGDAKFEVGDNVRYQNIKIFWQNVTLQIGLKKLLLLSELKILSRGHMILVILMVKKLLYVL